MVLPRSLRLLVMDDQMLLQLHQLESLQLRYSDFQRDPLLAIRRLSVQHRLRHLSLTPVLERIWLPSSRTFDTSPLDLNALVSELSGAHSGLAPAALVSIRLDSDLSEVSCSALLSLPNLTRLDWNCDAIFSESAVPSQSSLPLSPSPLQQLHLDFEHRKWDGAVELLQEAAIDIHAPQLRELHLTNLLPSLPLTS